MALRLGGRGIFVTMNLMRVGFDISQIAHRGGVATYTKNLAQKLEKDPCLEMVYFYSSLRKPYIGNLSNVKSVKIPPTLLEPLFNRFRVVRIEKFTGKVDIFHSSDWIQPKTSAKKVTTYHDVIPLKYPQWSHPKIVGVHKRRLALVEREIDMVIAVSEATKKDLMEISKVPEEKITVIYEGVDEKFRVRDKEEIEGFRRRYKLPEKFVLAIGGIGERRNLKRVKEATQGYNLVITGETIPWVGDEEMPLLYSAAEVLFYPSFYEGFGLPVIEAMACGTPVITSDVSSLPEAGGEAAAYVDPEDTERMVRVVREVMGDKELREEMINKGLVQAKKFSWKKCADETARIYKQLMEK